MAGALKKYSMDEVAKHNDSDTCWIVVRGLVYDVTDFLDEVGREMACRRAYHGVVWGGYDGR